MAEEMTASYGAVQKRAFLGGRVIAMRYCLVGLLSLAGSTYLIRALGSRAWATYTVAYFLITFVDQNIGTRLLGAVVHADGIVPVRTMRSAALLMQALGSVMLVAFITISLPAAALTRLVDVGICLAAVGVCAYVYASRSLSLVLLERKLDYRWVAVGEIVDQITFYGIAISLVLSHHGLPGVALALAVRGIPTAVLLRVRSRAPFIGGWDRTGTAELLRFALPTLGASAFVFGEGLVPIMVLGGQHARFLAFFMTSSSLIGYAAVAQVVVQRMGFPSFRLLRGAPEGLMRAVERTTNATVFTLTSMVVPMAGLSPLWLPALFGRGWRVASLALLPIGLGFVLAGVISVLSGALYTLGQPGKMLRGYATMTVLYGGSAFAATRISVAAGVGVAYAVSRIIGVMMLRSALSRRIGRVSMARSGCVVVLGASAAILLGVTSWYHAWLFLAVAVAILIPLWVIELIRNWSWISRAIGFGQPGNALVPG